MYENDSIEYNENREEESRKDGAKIYSDKKIW